MKRILYLYDFSGKALVAFQKFANNIKKYLPEGSYDIKHRSLTVIILSGDRVMYKFDYINSRDDRFKFAGIQVSDIVYDESSRFDPEIVRYLKTMVMQLY